MKEEEPSTASQSKTVYDPLSKTTFTLQAGHLLTETQGQSSQTWTIPGISTDNRMSNRQYLHFATPTTSHLQINPWGNLLISHSQRFQEADLSKAFTSGSAWWEFFVPHTTLSLTVGVKDKKNNKYLNFDFSLKTSGRLTFKLNLSELTLKVWVNGVQSQSKPVLTLPENGSWTPFVRIRDSGATLALNPFIDDPEGKQKLMPLSSEGDNINDLPDGDDERHEQVPITLKSDQSFEYIQLIGDHLLITGPRQVKVIPRSQYSQIFELDRAVQLQEKGEEPFYLLKVNQGEVGLLREATKVWKKNLMRDLIVSSGCTWLRKNKEQWINWAASVFNYIDTLRAKGSNQLTNQLYQLVLSIYTRIASCLNLPQQANPLCELDSSLLKQTQRLTLQAVNTQQTAIPRHLPMLAHPSLLFAQQIKGVSLSGNYLTAWVENNKISVFCIRGTPFKIGDFIFSKPIKKESQLIECAKQADQVKGALGQPVIYKILKNCLKYADKVRPPEKLVKQLEDRREKMRSKNKKKEVTELKEEPGKVVPNKDLQGTLIQMGFDLRVIRKALIQCNNASLQAGMDLIFGGTIVVQQEKPPALTKDWTCQTCTLVNACTATVCAACDTPMPALPQQIEKQQTKVEKESAQKIAQKIEEEIVSQRIEEELTNITVFSTGIAIAPFIVAGIFNSTVRFRLYALNPRFFSSCYEKGDLFADLVSHGYYDKAGAISSQSIEKLLPFLSSEECRDRSLSWLALEDFDINKKGVKSVQFKDFGFDTTNLRFKVTFKYGQSSQSSFFSLDTSKTYSEKQRSLTMTSQLKEQLQASQKIEQKQAAQNDYRLDYESSAKNASEFEVYLANNNRRKVQTQQVVLKPEQTPSNTSQLSLYVVHSSQLSANYPNVSILSPWKSGYNPTGVWKNGIVFGSLKRKLMRFDYISLQIKNKEDKLSGFFYFANDYTLQPCKVYRFAFQGSSKKNHYNVAKVKARYLIVILEPQHDDRLIELSSIHAYGQFVQDAIPNPAAIQVDLKKQSVFTVEATTAENQIRSVDVKQTQVYAINSTHDLTVYPNQLEGRVQDYTDLKAVVKVENIPDAKTTLKNVNLEGFTTLRANSIIHSRPIIKNEGQIDEQFNKVLNEYLSTQDKKALQRLVSSDFAHKRSAANMSSFNCYLKQHLVSLPFDNNQKNDAKIFLGQFLAAIKEQKDSLKLAQAIEESLRSSNLTANGLELLIWLNRQTQALSAEQLSNIFAEVTVKIHNRIGQKPSKEYDITSEESIFSPYLHTMGQLEDIDSSLDKLTSRILLRKLRYSRLFTIDLFSCFKLRQLELGFDRTSTQNKMIVTVRSFDNQGKLQGNLTFGYDYPSWTNVVSEKKGTNRSLKLSLEPYGITTRYVQVEVSFTLHPFNASKSQISNLADNQIMPTIFGSYVSETEQLASLQFVNAQKSSSLQFIRKIGHYSKYYVSNKPQTFLLMQEKVQANMQSLQKLKNTTELKANREKWISVMMRQPSQENLNYHYTLFTVLAEELLRMKNISQYNKPFLDSLISILNKETGILLDLSQKILKLVLEKYPSSCLDILRHPIEANYIASVFKKFNPFSVPQYREQILKELKTKNLVLARNSLLLLSEAFDSSNEDLKQIYFQLHKVLFDEGLFEECIVLHERNGWVSGLQGQLVYEVFQMENGENLIQRICKSARNPQDILTFLNGQIIKRGPSEPLLAVLDELAEKVKDEQLEGSQLFTGALKWLDKGQQQADIPSNVVQRLLKASCSFKLNQDTVSSLIGHLFEQRQRKELLTSMKNLPIFKQEGTNTVLLNIAIQKLGEWIKTPQFKRGHQSELLRFIRQVFTFTADSGYFSYQGKQVTLLLAKFLLQELNWHGRQGCRFLGESSVVHLTIACYLAKLSSEKEQSQQLNSLIQWYIANHNNQELPPSFSTAPGQFSLIQQKVWSIIVNNLQKSEQLAKEVQTNIVKYLEESTLLNKSNRFQAVRLRARIFSFVQKLLRELKDKPQLQKSIRCLLEKQKLFKNILTTLQNLSGFENEENQLAKEQQIVNDLKLLGQLQPKDWLTYRNGSKNHVFQLKYQGKQSHVLTFERQQAFWPAVIAVGFQTNSGNGGTVLAPRQIIVQMGDHKDKMNIVGHLNLIPFENFEGFSVKVFALNLYRLKSKGKRANRSQKLLRLTFTSPYESQLTDGAQVDNRLFASKAISYINFLSIQGFIQKSANTIPEDVTGLVGILELLSEPRHISDLTELLKDQENAKLFEKSIKGISYLLSSDKYANTAHKFLLRACQVNSALGEGMLNEYLKASNPVLSSKMVGQIVLTSQEHSVARVKRYYSSIIKKLQSSCKDAQLIPFIDNFVQTMSTLQRNYALAQSSTETSSCEISEKNIQLIITKSADSPSYRRLIKTIMAASSPLAFNIEPIKDNIKEKIWQQLFSSNNQADTELLAALINADVKCRQWFVSKDYLSSSFKKIIESLQGKDTNADQLENKLRFLTLLCRNHYLKQSVTKAQLDLQIFQLLVHGNSEGLMAKVQSKKLRDSLVNFIVVASLGSPNERIIGALLKDSLNTNVLEGSSKFVGQVFLPLLNSYRKTVVCMVPYSSEENKIMADLSSLQHFQAVSKTQLKRSDKFRLSSMILNDNAKDNLYQKVREHTGYRWGVFKLIANHGEMSSGKSLQALKQALNKHKQILIIAESSKRVLGVFYSVQKNPKKPSGLFVNKSSFVFEGTSSEVKPVQKASNKQLLASIDKVENNDCEVLSIYANGKQAAEITFDGFGGSTMFARNQGEKNQTINSVQYWYFDADSQESYDHVWTNEKMFTRRLLSQLSDCSFFRSQFKVTSNLGLLRQEPLFEFPSSLTVKQLLSAIEILGKGVKADAKFQLRLGNGGPVDLSATLEQLAKGETGELILDLLVDLEGVVESLDMGKQEKPAEFLPIRGILKYFEENDGVKTMIKAIKKSISDWNNVARKEKWMQYINQLEKFSGFPHFFGVYFREKQTFNLMLDLLSGLPDKETDTKWDQKQVQSSQRLLNIISEILKMENSQQFRNHAIKHDFLITILGRLKILAGIYARHYEQTIEQEEVVDSPNKKVTEDDVTKKVKKKKGVGYSAQTNSNTKWMKGDNLAAQKKEFQSIQPILQLIEGFLGGGRNWKAPPQILKQILNSCLLPFIEDCLRAGTLLQMSKHPEKYRAILKLIRAIAKQQNLVSALVPLSPHYQPAQIQSVQSLLKSLNNTSKIFLSCLSQNLSKEDKLSQQLANDLITTYNIVDEAVIQLQAQGEEGEELQHALSLPLDKKYRLLMKELRFDYMDMKQSATKIKHHYASNFHANYKPNQVKMIRLAQQLADISTALPHQHTNAVYVRCDKDRVDFMQALIMGSNGTPYGHGAFLFDIYFDDNYPNGPPKVNLTTTGHGKIRFNPNLYACGKVCLSLLGTWRGSVTENWDSKISTLLQVLLSIQAIIMSEEVYFNEPGFENEQGTQQGEKKNEAYSNIVRYGNLKFAMLENIKNPPKGFESVIRRHFYLKKDQIMEQCRKWQKYAEKRPANYVGLVNDHNSSWAAEFKKSKTQYKEMLDKTISELQEELNKLPPPSASDLAAKQGGKRTKKKKEGTDMKTLQNLQHEEIDVTYQKKTMNEDRELDINDEKVRDRWSRYIGAMGIDAVGRQAKADIMVIGLGPFALEVVKNLVLSGCRKLTIVEDGLVKLQDLAGGFFYHQEDIGKKRVQSVLYKIRELNSYVKVDSIPKEELKQDLLAKYTLILATQISHEQQLKLSQICRDKKVKFVSADCFGAACRITNDYGKFQVLDKNGEEPVEVMIKDIQISEKGLVTLLDGVKHPYEDGQAIVISQIQGMKLKEDASKSINGAIRKVKVVNFKSFQIGDTRMFEPYVRNGTAKNIKTPVTVEFPPLEKALDPKNSSDVDPELQFFDFAKQPKSALLRLCFITLDQFRAQQGKFPEPWDLKDAQLFKQYFEKNCKEDLTPADLKFVSQFAYSCKGNLPPLCAFFGGLVSQEIIKGITQKYKPITPSFYINFMELLPSKEEDKEWTAEELKEIYTKSKERDEGLIAVIGKTLVKMVSESRIFMVGAGAIGCQLLKNMAMVGLGTGQSGKIFVTDPDHIENSNLNRQFLFRQKHISKPKSLTAAASVTLMNPKLKNHITPLLERVSEATRQIFSNRFFGNLTAVTNALDNVAARRYVDQRCVENQMALFESGTLGPKGHVQVILPFKTESYGSQNDPVQEGQIPHCTLKLFPQQTLHCIEWARDIFGRKFALQPKALAKFLQKGYIPDVGDIKALTESLKMVTKGPKLFDDCVEYAVHKFYKYYRDDVMQLLYTYPLDAKTKNGQPFWRLPKRPPTPILKLDPEDPLHTTFIMSLAVLIAKIYQIPYPKDFRSQKQRLVIGKQAAAIKIQDFVPSDEKAKAILKQATAEEKQKENKDKDDKMAEDQEKLTEEDKTHNENELYKEIMQKAGETFQIKAQQFEKDDDANGHIDFIYASSNLRALNYKLQPMDWITTKLKAGRIVPALVTTTSCVAGLQIIQLLKYLKKTKVDLMRNAYINLAVPSMQMSEPGELQKKKLRQGLQVSLWDKWELHCQEDVTFGEVYEKLKKQYGLCPMGVLQGMSRIDIGKTPAEKKKFLSSKVLDKVQREEEYLDIVVLFTDKEEDEKILQGVPPVRLHFPKK